MYKNFLRALSLLLALIMLSAVVISCDKASTNEDNETDVPNSPTNSSTEKPGETNPPIDEPTEPEREFLPLDEADFEGKNLTLLLRDNKQYAREWYKAELEDELDESVWMRNEEVKSNLNVTVTYELVPDANYDAFSTNFNSIITDDIVSGTHKYDIASNNSYAATYTAVRGFAADLNNEKLFPYFDFSLPCWNQSIVNNTAVNGKLYCLAGDITLTTFDSAAIIWYNVDLYNELKDETDPKDMQVHVCDGLWTYQDLYMWAARAYDSSKTTGASVHGFSIASGKSDRFSPYDAIPYAWDLEFMITNSDNTRSFNFANNSKAEDALVKFRSLLTANGTLLNGNAVGFAKGDYVFLSSVIHPDHESNMAIREMFYRYSLLPIPKYDASQDNYATTAANDYTLITALDHSEGSAGINGREISAFLQSSAECTREKVVRYYFNRIIKHKYFGTDDYEGNSIRSAIEIFYIIINSIKLDYCTVYSPQLNNIAWLWRDTVNKEGVDLEEAFLDDEKNYLQALKDTDAWLGLGSTD